MRLKRPPATCARVCRYCLFTTAALLPLYYCSATASLLLQRYCLFTTAALLSLYYCSATAPLQLQRYCLFTTAALLPLYYRPARTFAARAVGEHIVRL
jgi:hypothetical protein